MTYSLDVSIGKVARAAKGMFMLDAAIITAESAKVSEANAPNGEVPATRRDPKYISLLERNVRLSPSPVLNNSSPAQFTMATDFLFQRSQKRVVVSTNYLPRYSHKTARSLFSPLAPPVQPVWAGVIEGALEFLRREETQLDIIIRCYLDTVAFPNEHEFLNAIITDEQRKGTIRLFVAPEHDKYAIEMLDYNFVVFDDLHFRQEVDQYPITAVLQFGNRSAAANLVRAFDSMIREIEKGACPPLCLPVMALTWNEGNTNPQEGTCIAGAKPPHPWNLFVKAISAPPVGKLRAANGR